MDGKEEGNSENPIAENGCDDSFAQALGVN